MIYLLVKLVLAVLFLGGLGFFVFKYSGFVSFNDQTSSVNSPQQQLAGLVKKCGEECEAKIREIVDQAVATLSSQPEASLMPTPTVRPISQVKSTPAPQPKTRVHYINLTNVGLTTRNEWADLNGTDFAFDTGVYGNVKEVRWIPKIKTSASGGEASSRLFDVTNGISVPGSEVSTRNTSFTEVESAAVTLKSSRSTYRVQIKTLSGYETNFEGGKLKILTVD